MEIFASRTPQPIRYSLASVSFTPARAVVSSFDISSAVGFGATVVSGFLVVVSGALVVSGFFVVSGFTVIDISGFIVTGFFVVVS